MRNYPLHDLNDDEFENLTTLICRKILGEAIIPFAKGTDVAEMVVFMEKRTVFQVNHNLGKDKLLYKQNTRPKLMPAAPIQNFKRHSKMKYYLP